jgi:hypothetical protein
MTDTEIGPIDTIYKEDSVETVATEYNPVQRISDIENNINESLLRENKLEKKCPLAFYCCAIFVIFSVVFVLVFSLLKLI